MQLELMMEQLLEEHKKNSNNINVKGDRMHNGLHGKFKALNMHMRVLESQVSHTSASDACTGGNVSNDKKPPYVPPPPYVPKIPFSTMQKNKIQENEYDKMKSIVQEFQVRLTFVDVERMVPTLKKYKKNILTDKISL